MFSSIGGLFSENLEVSQEKSCYKPIIFICTISLLIFSIGYVLRPVSKIVDELHDSNDE